MKKQILFSIFILLFCFSKNFAQELQDEKIVEIAGIAYYLHVVPIISEEESIERHETIVKWATVAPLTLIENSNNCNYSGKMNIPREIEYNGIIYSVDGLEQDCFSNCDELESVTISSFGNLGYFAYSNCPKLKHINMADFWGNAYFDSYAINNCPNLRVLNLPSQLKELYHNAIEASNLEHLELPNSLNRIENEALCLPSLKELICRVQLPSKIRLKGNPFGSGENAINLKECLLRVPSESVEAYKNADYWREFEKILPIEETDFITPEADTICDKAYDLLGRPASSTGMRIVKGKKTLVR